MNKLKLLVTLALVTLIVPILSLAAPSPILDSANLYKVKNQTAAGSWGTSVTASPDQKIAFLVHLHNGVIDSTATNVTAKVTLPAVEVTNFTSTATVSASNASPVSANTQLNLTKSAKIVYVPGSTVLYNHANQVEANLPDGITTTGITALTSLNGCWQYEKWVRFEAVVVAEPEAPTCTLSADPSTITKGANSTLSYTTTNATSASIDNGVGNVALPSGTVTVAPSIGTTYTLTVHGQDETVLCNSTVSVTNTPNPPIVITTGKGNTPVSGPAEAAAGAVGLTSIGGAAFAWLRSKKDLLGALKKIK